MKHILESYEKELQQSREQVLTMASIARRNLANAFRGLLERNLELCNGAIADDEEVDRLEMQIDQQGMEILMRFQPVAHDLRQMISTIRISNNLERISDEAVNIARRARKINKVAELEDTTLVQPVYDMASAMIRDSIQAYADRDVEASLRLAESDNQLNKIYKQVVKRLTKAIETRPEHAKVLIHLIFVLHCLERIGDHAKNICEETIFMESATDVRHGGRQEMQNRSA
ncbi:MAG: phosphate signaling complex protein PhoU [Verrucomicrobiales bacterium]